MRADEYSPYFRDFLEFWSSVSKADVENACHMTSRELRLSRFHAVVQSLYKYE